MKKSKGQTIDLLYTNKEETKKTKSVEKTSSRTHKNKKNRTRKIQNNNKIINLDNEIIIGLTPKKEENKKNKKTTNKKTKSVGADVSVRPKKNNKKVIGSNVRVHNCARQTKNNSNKNEQKKSKKIKKLKIIKWTSIVILLVIAIIMFMMSSVFNIKQIIVSNNNKITTEEIISLSKLTIGTNMFKASNKTINNNIKTNSYIDNVKIKKKLNGTVILEIQERTPTYMLQLGNLYVYINNQGYMLEITEELLNVPIITGLETTTEEIKEGNRLIVNDLEKLEDIIKIMESAKSNSLSNIITSIDISDKTNYKLTIASENKIVQFGDTTNINIKLLKIEEIIEQEKGISGEIYFQDSEKTVFREMVNF